MKTDRTDARALARLHKAGVLSTCFVPDEEERSRREILRHRLRLVKNRTAVRNRIHAPLDKHVFRVPYKTKFSKKGVAWMRELSIGFMDDAILHSDLALLAALDARAPDPLFARAMKARELTYRKVYLEMASSISKLNYENVLDVGFGTSEYQEWLARNMLIIGSFVRTHDHKFA